MTSKPPPTELKWIPGNYAHTHRPIQSCMESKRFQEKIDNKLSINVIEQAQTESVSTAFSRPIRTEPSHSAQIIVNTMPLQYEIHILVKDAWMHWHFNRSTSFFQQYTLTESIGKLKKYKADQEKTYFTSHPGLYHFPKMPFCLIKAPTTSQCALDIILSSVQWQLALMYLEDIVIFSKTP